MQTFLSTVALCACFSLVGFGQTAPITADQARAAARVALDEAQGDERRFRETYQRELRKIDRDYRNDAKVDVILFPVDLTIVVRGPASLYGQAVSERLRKLEPADGALWPEGIGVGIFPQTIHAPNIERCVLTTAGQTVGPLISTLRPSEQRTMMGLTVTRSSGSIWYRPGDLQVGSVLTCIPTTGKNIVKTFSARDLKQLK
jgi:hypothetical protein